MIKKELLLICDCMCLNHIIHFVYYPPEKKSDYEDNSIFIQMRSINLYSKIIPPLNFYAYDWKDYIKFNYFKRFGIIFKYLFKISHKEEPSIFDSFDFQIKDLKKIDKFLLNYKTKEDVSYENIYEKNKIEIEDYKKRYKIIIKKTFDELNIDTMHTIRYDFKFCDGNIWERLKTSFDYLFFSKNNEEKEFEIKEVDDILGFKSMIENVFISNLDISDSVKTISEEMIKEFNKVD